MLFYDALKNLYQMRRGDMTEASRKNKNNESLMLQSRGKRARSSLFARMPNAGAGTFLSGVFSNSAGSRPYKLYIPPSYAPDTPVPLLVALHGCTQDPDNFAAGTRFNILADRNNFLVLYPQQTGADHPTKCWAWYDPVSQQRGSGEPAILAGMVDALRSTYSVDAKRVFITGMSAGAAMAVILAACYPDYFAAVGVHSGLEYKAACDLTSATAALSKGGPDPDIQGRLAYLSAGAAARVLPIIVFHGMSDYTVSPLNGDQVIQQFARTNDYADDGVANNSINAIPSSIQTGQVPNGCSYTLSTYTSKGRVLMQKYLVDGLGHAWSGGSIAPPATFTNPRGPDASTLMWNFFVDHPKSGRGLASFLHAGKLTRTWATSLRKRFATFCHQSKKTEQIS